MTDLERKAMEMALEALAEYTCTIRSGTDITKWDEIIDGGEPAREAIKALRQALAQPEKHLKFEGPTHVVCQCDKCKAQPKPEPVAWMDKDGDVWAADSFNAKDKRRKMTPLYTAPQNREWVGLTDDEIEQGLLRSDYALQTAHAWRSGVIFAMTKLKEKNT